MQLPPSQEEIDSSSSSAVIDEELENLRQALNAENQIQIISVTGLDSNLTEVLKRHLQMISLPNSIEGEIAGF